MPKKKTAAPTPPEDMDQALADDLVDLHETNPDLFPDRDEQEWNRQNGYPEDTAPEDRDPEDRVRAEEEAAEPDFVIVDSEPETADPAPEQEEDALEKANRVLNFYALKKALEAQIKDILASDKEDVLEALSVVWKKSKAKTFEVRIPTVNGDEVKIAQATLMIKEEEVKVDDEMSFTSWLAENRPELVRKKHHPAEPARPAMPAWDEEVPAADAVEALMDTCKVEIREEATTRGTRTVREIVDTTTGSIVPGLRHVPTQDPDGMRLTWLGPGSPGRRKALELLVHDEVAGMSLDTVMPRPELER